MDAAAVKSSLRRRLLVTAGIVVAVIGVVMPLVTYFQGGDLRVSAIAIGFVMVITLFSLLASFSRQRRWLMTYTLRIGDDDLARDQEHVVALRIGRSEIARIVEGSGGLAVMTSSPERCIGVPRTLERYVEVREALATWRTIEPADDFRWTPTIVLLAIMAVSAASAFAPGTWAIVTAFVLWAMVAYSIWNVRRATDVRRDHKNVATVFLLWLALTPIGRVGLPILGELMQKLADWH